MLKTKLPGVSHRPALRIEEGQVRELFSLT
jgi:hypothetical protein